MSLMIAFAAVAALAGATQLLGKKQGSRAKANARKPRISKNLARERLLEVLPPHKDLEYLGSFDGWHRFRFYDTRTQKSRIVEAGGLSSLREHFTYRFY